MTANLAAEIAVQTVILDALEKGHTNVNEMVAYMETKVFNDAVARYVLLLTQTFN